VAHDTCALLLRHAVRGHVHRNARGDGSGRVRDLPLLILI